MRDVLLVAAADVSLGWRSALMGVTAGVAVRTTGKGRRAAVGDWYAFTLSFKGVVLEGLEVAFIVVTFGSNQGSIPLAVVGAAVVGAAAVLVVPAAWIAVRGPLAQVLENTLKFVVGVLLGTFWGAEGTGARWPGNDAALLVVIAVVSMTAVACLRTVHRRLVPEATVTVASKVA